MIQEITQGQVVISKSGRDKGRAFVIYKVEGKTVYIVDGDLRKVEKPKKKNSLHLKLTNIFLPEFSNRLRNGEPLRNQDLRKELAEVFGSSGEVRS